MIGFGLEGKTVVVTGASKNIGAAISRGFAAAGADVLMVARGSAGLDSVAAAIREQTGARIEAVAADVSQESAADTIADAARDAFGGIDILVNNAFSGGSALEDVLQTPEPVWDEVLSTNLLGPWRLIRACAPSMSERPGASVTNVVSGSGFLPTPKLGAYGVSKAALWMLTRYLAVEMAPHIRVNALCPGVVTPAGQAEHEVHRKLLPLVPMGRLGRPEEMVGAALYLASDLASYTTGAIIFANGGRPW